MNDKMNEILYNYNGKPVVDGIESLQIEIVDQDIETGVACDPTACPIAQGIRRTTPGIQNVRVGATIVFVEMDDIVLRYRLTATQAKWVKEYDASGNFRPGVYDLLPPYSYSLHNRQGSNVRMGLQRNVQKSPALRQL